MERHRDAGLLVEDIISSSESNQEIFLERIYNKLANVFDKNPERELFFLVIAEAINNAVEHF